MSIKSLAGSFKAAAAELGAPTDPFATFNAQTNNNDTTFKKDTLLGSISGGQSFKVQSTSITSANTTMNNNVANQSVNVTAQASAVKAQTTFVKGQISESIRTAKQEVIATQKECGHGGAMVFANNSSASSNLAGAMTGGAATGISQLLDACSDMRGAKDAKKIIAEITEKLQSKSQPITPTLKAPGEQAQAPQQTKINWNTFFDDGHKLDDLMSIDENNIENSKHLLPEVKELDNIEKYADQKIAEAKIAEQKANNDITVDPKHFVEKTQNSLSNISHCSLPKCNISNDIKEAIAKNTHEPPQEIRLNAAPQSLSM